MVAYIISMSDYEQSFLCIVAKEMAAHQERMLMQHRDRMLHRDRPLMHAMEEERHAQRLLRSAADLVVTWHEAHTLRWKGVHVNTIMPPKSAAGFDIVKRYIEEGAPTMDAIKSKLIPPIGVNHTITEEQLAEALPSVVAGAKRIVLSVAAGAI